MAETGAAAGAVAAEAAAGMAAEIAADVVAEAAEDAAEGLVEGGGSFTIEKVRFHKSSTRLIHLTDRYGAESDHVNFGADLIDNASNK